MTSQSCGASWCQNQPKNPYFRPEMAGNGTSPRPEAQGNTRNSLYTTENIYLEYMNINHEPVATRLMIDIKQQPDRVLVDV